MIVCYAIRVFRTTCSSHKSKTHVRRGHAQTEGWRLYDPLLVGASYGNVPWSKERQEDTKQTGLRSSTLGLVKSYFGRGHGPTAPSFMRRITYRGVRLMCCCS